eukprot:jgi/Mesen1/1444/ME000132S00379
MSVSAKEKGIPISLKLAAGLPLVGVGAAALFCLWPRDPVFEVLELQLKGFKLRWCTDSPLLVAVVDVELLLRIKVTNKNVVGISYGETTMDIFYRDTLLGQAKVPAGSQGPRTQVINDLPARLDGLQITNLVTGFLEDFAKREMSLTSLVTISGEANVFPIKHPFKIHVHSEIVVDPIFLDVKEQDNQVKMEI